MIEKFLTCFTGSYLSITDDHFPSCLVGLRLKRLWCRINAWCRFHINIVGNRYEVCAVLKNDSWMFGYLSRLLMFRFYWRPRVMVWWISITVPIISGRCQWWLVSGDWWLCLLLNWCVLGFEITQFWTIDFISAVPRKNMDISFIYGWCYTHG